MNRLHQTGVLERFVLFQGTTHGVRIFRRERRRVDGCGIPFTDSKSFHVVISKGSQPGQRHVMEGEGDETVDTLPGDLVFVLQQKPHPQLKRSGIGIHVCTVLRHPEVNRAGCRLLAWTGFRVGHLGLEQGMRLGLAVANLLWRSQLGARVADELCMGTVAWDHAGSANTDMLLTSLQQITCTRLLILTAADC